MLGVAAGHGDTVGLLPAPIKNSADRDDPRDLLPAALDQKIPVLRAKAGGRFPALELTAFVTIPLSDHTRADTQALITRRRSSGIDSNAVWHTPTLLIR